MLICANLTLQHISTISFTFSSWPITSNFSSVLTLFGWFCTWIALCNVDLCFSLILVTKGNAVEGGTISAAWSYHQCDQSTQVTWQWCHLMLAPSTRRGQGSSKPNHVKLKIIAWIQKWCKFPSHIKVKLHKNNPACSQAGLFLLLLLTKDMFQKTCTMTE